jgi:riboflavin biosynthesis pyrimidine reductase
VRRLVPPTGPIPLEEAYADLQLHTGPPGGERAGVSLGMVASVDGAVALDGRSGGLGGDADRVAFLRLRDACDAILVGAGTARAEDYGPPRQRGTRRETRVAAGLAPVPQLLVVTGSAALDPASRLLAATGDPDVPRPVVVTHRGAPTDAVSALRAVTEVVEFGATSVDLAAVLRWCVERGWRRVLCEGGPSLNGALLDAGLVDEVLLTVAPTLVAGAAGRIVRTDSEVPTPLELRELHEYEGELLVRYRVTDRPTAGS